MTNIAEKTAEKPAEQNAEQTAPGGTRVEPSRRPDRRRRILLVTVAVITMLGLGALLLGGVLFNPAAASGSEPTMTARRDTRSPMTPPTTSIATCASVQAAKLSPTAVAPPPV